MKLMGDNATKRNALLTTLIYLMLKAPEELLQVDKNIIQSIFALAELIEGDDDVKENVLWLQSALIEINISEETN